MLQLWSNKLKALAARNLRFAGQMRPAWTFDVARIRIFITQFRVQDRVKMKLHDKQYLDSKPEVSIP